MLRDEFLAFFEQSEQTFLIQLVTKVFTLLKVFLQSFNHLLAKRRRELLQRRAPFIRSLEVFRRSHSWLLVFLFVLVVLVEDIFALIKGFFNINILSSCRANITLMNLSLRRIFGRNNRLCSIELLNQKTLGLSLPQRGLKMSFVLIPQ